MLKSVNLALAALLAAAGAAGAANAQPYAAAPAHGGPGYGHCPPAHHGDVGCWCPHEAVFYTPGPSFNVSHRGGPAVRVYSQPVYVPSGRIDIQGPPVLVEAPPIRVAPVQIYLHAPDVRVKPSQVIVEPPVVHTAPCPSGRCPPP